MRLFLAIRIDEGILRALEGGVGKLRQTRAAVRWVRPEGIHLTVRFLGETGTDRVGPLVEKMGGICAQLEPFPFSVVGMGSFPGSGRPRVVWAGVEEPSGTLKRLWALTEKAVTGLGWEKEKRGYSPHITLGRVKGPINLPRMVEVLETMEEQDWGRQEARDLVLFSSRLEAGGAKYEEVRVFPLGRPRARLS